MYVNVEIDVDEVIRYLSERELNELCDELIGDGYGSTYNANIDEIRKAAHPVTHTQRTLLDLLLNIWENKHHISQDQIYKLQDLLEKSKIL